MAGVGTSKEDKRRKRRSLPHEKKPQADKARRYENKGFQFTRRIIALTAVFFDVSVFLTWTEFSRGFLFLIEQKEMLVDRQFAGVVITPMDTHLMASIIGLYFGGSLVKK